MTKATIEEIRERFDSDVERFSDLETGQSATIDAPLVLELTAQAAAATNPDAACVLDVGCGAGNYTLKLLEYLPNLHVDLVDLSRPMLDRAVERVSAVTAGKVATMQGDIRDLSLESQRYDVIMAAAVLHHLRDDSEWESVFATFYDALVSGGSLWISDLIFHSVPALQTLMWQRYGNYLRDLKDDAYRDHVFDYIEKEDSPRPLLYQIDLLRQVGFSQMEILHKNTTFAAFGAIK